MGKGDVGGEWEKMKERLEHAIDEGNGIGGEKDKGKEKGMVEQRV